jgi:hypothetical protein
MANRARRAIAIGTALVALAAAACGGSTSSPGSSSGTSGGNGGGGAGGGDGGGHATIAASDFDRSCATDADCRIVTEGDVCALCSCPNAAIAKSAAEEYSAKRQELAATCGPRPAIGCAADCASIDTWCEDGTCAAGVRLVDAGAD